MPSGTPIPPNTQAIPLNYIAGSTKIEYNTTAYPNQFQTISYLSLIHIYKITEAFAIVEDPGFYKFFVLGILFLVATIVLIIWIVKITLIVLMSNPIFTALATVLIVSSIFVCANK